MTLFMLTDAVSLPPTYIDRKSPKIIEYTIAISKNAGLHNISFKLVLYMPFIH